MTGAMNEQLPETTPYRPLHGPARWLVAVFVVIAAIDLVAVAAGVAEIRLLSRAIDGELVSAADAHASDARVAAVAFAQTLGWVTCGVLFLVWLRRAYTNLPVLGAGPLRFRPGWTIGAWFVPVLNLWRPKQIVNEIWRGSDGARETGVESRVPAWVAMWWSAYVVGWMLSLHATRMEDTTASDLREASMVFVVSDVVDIVAAVLAIALVRAVTHRQAALHATGAPAAAPAS